MSALRHSDCDEHAGPRLSARHGQSTDVDDIESAPAAKRKPTPVPMFQLLVLCAVRIVEPIAFTQIFPYVNEMMASFHLTDDPSKMGFYSGIVESIFAISQLFSIYHWARTSDRIGRKPIILVGVFGMALTTALFGLSRTLLQTLGARFITGLFSGNVAVMHSVVGELTDSSNQAIAFPIYGLVWPVGAIIGPLIGGTFSHPATNFPSLFDFPLLRTFPFFLPCFIAALIAIGGLILGAFCFEETLPSKRRNHMERNGYIPLAPQTERKRRSSESLDSPDSPDSPSSSSRDSSDSSTLYSPDSGSPDSPLHQFKPQRVSAYSDSEDKPTSEGPMSMRGLLAIPVMLALSLSGSALAFFAAAFDVVFVLFCYSPIAVGGLGLDPSQIGYILSLSGILSIAIQLFLMPTLLRRFDCAKMYGVCMSLWPVTFALLPGLNIIARLTAPAAAVLSGPVQISARELANTVMEASSAVHEGVADPAQAIGVGPMVWLGIAGILLISRLATIAFGLSMILVKDHAPSPATLGTANGLVQFTMCAARAVSPAFVSSLFALSVDNHILGGYFWVIVMILLSIGGSRITGMIERNSGRKSAGWRARPHSNAGEFVAME